MLVVPHEPNAARVQYKKLSLHRLSIIVVLLCLLLVSIIFDVATGPALYSITDVVMAIVNPGNQPDKLRVVVWDIRLPIALMAVLVGAALSLAGAQMQTILSNPLASPFTLGISAAASFGAALALVSGIALFPMSIHYVVPMNAFIMAMGAALFIHFASTMRSVTVETIILLGIALVFAFNAALALLQYLASQEALSAVIFWSMGSLTKATWAKVGVTALVLVSTLPFFIRNSWSLTAMRLGDEKAASMGINVSRLRLHTMLIVSLLAAVPVAFVGAIGFVGIVAPHIARMLVGEDQRYFFPASVICGAILLSATSVLSKVILPGAVIPIGIITALIGVPFFFALIFSNRRQLW